MHTHTHTPLLHRQLNENKFCFVVFGCFPWDCLMCLLHDDTMMKRNVQWKKKTKTKINVMGFLVAGAAGVRYFTWYMHSVIHTLHRVFVAVYEKKKSKRIDTKYTYTDCNTLQTQFSSFASPNSDWNHETWKQKQMNNNKITTWGERERRVFFYNFTSLCSVFCAKY